VRDSFARAIEAADALDGLNLSTVDTARMLRERLGEQQQQDLLAQLDQAMAQLQPQQLQLPAYERDTPPAGGEGGQRRGRRGRRGG
jgi:hypothetical protein